ncbi:MAG TPA: DUF4178 domain-containing protein [Chitinophagaceae bacterium]|nr:DUF4178 domain-containing protein [Chitinophagaceae bacterium]
MNLYSSIVSCPGCSKTNSFQHADTNVIACSCGTILKRTESNLQSQAFYLLQNDHDLIQVGTEGIWKGKKFSVLGRFRAWIEEYVFNYWTISFEDNKLAYLGEGYGLYAIYEKREDTEVSLSFLNEVKVGQNKEILGESYLVERKYNCYKWEVEGELYLPELSSNFKILELAHTSGRRIELMQGPKDTLFAFSVFYTSYSELKLSGLRNGEVTVKTISCARCSRQNEIKAVPYTQSFACPHCGTRYTLEGGDQFKRTSDPNAGNETCNIALGSKGLIKGVDYEVIGFALKEEQNAYRSRWKEYTLYNKTEGFAFLSEYNGHWVYLREAGEAPVLPLGKVTEFKFNDEPFQLFNSYRFKTIHAAGSFPYNIFNDGDKDIKEFISPPEVWILEKNSREGIVWFLGEHISGDALSKAFGESIVLPFKVGVGAVQPKGFVNPMKLATVTFFVILSMLFLHLFTSQYKDQRVVFSNDVFFPDSSNVVSFVSEKFHLDKWRSNLLFQVYAPVDNSWFELGVTLVNKETGTEYSLHKGVEYYHGYSDGESWAEGDNRESAYLSQIPGGDYILQIQGIRESNYNLFAASKTSNFALTVTYDVPNDRNLVYCLIAIIAFALIQYKLNEYNEKNRWENSPYSPYTYED